MIVKKVLLKDNLFIIILFKVGLSLVLDETVFAYLSSLYIFARHAATERFINPFMDRRISLSDVARQTGFAVPTVSLALRNAGTVSQATRKKIQEAARALGYVPNPLLAALASKQFGSGVAKPSIAYINHFDPQNTRHFDSFKCTQRRAAELGYSLDYFETADFRDGAHATQVLFSRGVQGIILPHWFDLKMLPGMDWNRFSVVEVEGDTVETIDSPRPLFSGAVVDHFGLALRAWNETWKRGYRRIGFALFNLDPQSMDDRQRWSAVQLCQHRVSARLRVPPFFLMPGNEQSSGDGELRKWLERYRPDAVIGFNSAFIWFLKEAGRRIPEDIGFASLHKQIDPEISLELDPESGMKFMYLECQLASLELLDQQIRRHQCGLPRRPRTVMVHSEWVDGDSLPPRVPSSDEDIILPSPQTKKVAPFRLGEDIRPVRANGTGA
jgi:LacI family transcriptional regulator